MQSDEIITLQIGKYANFVGTHLWNVREQFNGENVTETCVYHHCDNNFELTPRCVMVDLFENFGDYPSEGIQQTRAVDSSVWSGSIAQSNVNIGENADCWSDISNCSFHDKSLFQLPKWASNKNFDSFYKGKDNSIISDDCIEEIIDRLRYFAEACNHVTAVQCFFDMQQGFGGVSATVVERIRDDFGSICLPVYAFGEAEVNNRIDMIDKLKSLNIPLCYNSLMEHANMFVPINCVQASQKLLNAKSSHSVADLSLVSALAIETVSLFEIKNSLKYCSGSYGIQEFVNSCTLGKRFPLCSLETNISKNEFPLVADSAVDKIRNRESQSVINPFMTSLSFSNYYKVNHSIDIDSKPFTNVVGAVGNYSRDFIETISRRSMDTHYRITNSIQSNVSLYLAPDRYKSFFGYEVSDNHSVNAVAALGANQQIGHHLIELSECWVEGAAASKVQLEKLGVTNEDILEINENFIRGSQEYL